MDRENDFRESNWSGDSALRNVKADEGKRVSRILNERSAGEVNGILLTSQAERIEEESLPANF